MWELIFWFCVFAVVYPYAGYPLVLALLGRIRKPDPVECDDITPSVSLVISVYNEQTVIRDKIENALELDYPAEKLEVFVASDGSTDQTCPIVREYQDRGVVLHHHPDRRGKTEVLNEIAPLVRGEILVFTDANGMYRPDAVRQLVRPFADPRVGSVCGELIYQNPNQNLVADGYNQFWRYDQWLKGLETRLHCLLGSNGSIFAVRRELNEWLDPRVSNDMILPIKIAARGHAVLYVPDALSVESGSSGAQEELRRRSRIVARGLTGTMLILPDLIRKRRWLLLLQLFSRKVMRYFFPVLLIALFVSNLFLNGLFYRFTLLAQAVPYLLVPLGYYLSRRGVKVRFLSLPYYFCIGNLAALKGLAKAFTRSELATWEGFDRRYDLALKEGARGSAHD